MHKNKYEAIQVDVQLTLVSPTPLSQTAWSKIVEEEALAVFSPSLPATLEIGNCLMLFLSSRASTVKPDNRGLSAVVKLEHRLITRKGEDDEVFDKMPDQELRDMFILDAMIRFIDDERASRPQVRSSTAIHWNGLAIPFDGFQVGAITMDIEVTEAQTDAWWKATKGVYTKKDETPK